MSATRPSPACPASWRQESDGRAHFACAPDEAVALARLGYGLYDTLLFPIPTYKGTYAPPYKSNVQWI